MDIKVSLIISTYNWPQALHFSLASALKLILKPHEIIIADDGSTSETKEVIQNFSCQSPIPIKHVWHEDKGFRLSHIRNKAITEAEGNYIVQIDGDIIMHPYFIYDHIYLAKKNYFVTGSRSMITEGHSKKLLSSHTLPSIKQLNSISKQVLNRTRNRFLMSFFSSRYKVSGKYLSYTKGCNMAFWKDDFIEVNGYNEEISGWGREDQELAVRFLKRNIKKQFIKFGGITYHIWHPLASREKLSTNDTIMQTTLLSHSFRCQVGVDQYQDDVSLKNSEKN